jgi:hypothetical protein
MARRVLVVGPRRAHPLVLAILIAVARSLGAQHPARDTTPKRSPCPSVAIPTQPTPAPARCGLYCGTERWQVKTLSDADARRVRLTPVATTVESLAALPRPRYLPAYGRAGRPETTIFCVEGWLTEFTTEPDFDLHVIIAGLDDTTATIIVEFPDARCSGVCASGFRDLMAQARQALEHKLQTFSTDTLRVRVMGVGFFDRPHGQYGAAPNYIELHPVLAIEFP